MAFPSSSAAILSQLPEYTTDHHKNLLLSGLYINMSNKIPRSGDVRLLITTVLLYHCLYMMFILLYDVHLSHINKDYLLTYNYM